VDSPSLFFATKFEILFGEKVSGHKSAKELLKLLRTYEENK